VNNLSQVNIGYDIRLIYWIRNLEKLTVVQLNKNFLPRVLTRTKSLYLALKGPFGNPYPVIDEYS
jgi:hypothetical protein